MTNTNYSRGQQRKRNRKKQQNTGTVWLVLGVILIILLLVLIFVINRRKSASEPGASVGNETSVSVQETTFDKTTLKHTYEVDLSSIPGCSGKSLKLTKGMDRNDVLKAIRDGYEWNITIVNNEALEGSVVKPTVDAEETTAVGNGDQAETNAEEAENIAALTEIIVSKKIRMDDPVETAALDLIEKVFQDDKASNDDSSINIYTLDFDLESAVQKAVQDADDMWYVEPKGGSIESYDPANDQFLMEGSKDGCRIDKDKLSEDINAQIKKGNINCSIPVKLITLSSNDAVKNGEYQIIAQYVTHTTGNPVRNKNIQLACEKLNGTIVRPGEEFSYNYTIGERTAEKGYGSAAAYLNGEVIQEIGGGVCQLSSTLYNAITEAGLKATYRSPHTFKPTYVTPGQDATVSWNGPDFRFANVIANPDISYDTTYAIGIRSVYHDQTVTVTLYGRPVLKPGYKLTMESEMTGETEVVRVLIPEGSDKQPTTGDKGSTWKTYLLITKDGLQVSRELFHSTKYQGHTEYYLETVETSESVTETESTSIDPAHYGPGFITMESPSVNGPGTETLPQQNTAQTSESSVHSSEQNGPQIIDEPNGPPGGPYQSEGIAPGGIIQDGP